MAADFAWSESNTAGETKTTPTNINFGSTDAKDLVALTYPITAGEHSYEKWIQAAFSGTFSVIDNIQFWKSAGDYVTGETIDWSGVTAAASFATPVATESSVATTVLPTADPGTANVWIAGSLSGTLTSAGSSDYIVMQLHTTGSTPAGAVNTKTFTLQYDEV